MAQTLWTIVAAICAAVGFLVIASTVAFVAWLLVEMRRERQQSGEIDPTPAWVQLREHPDVAYMWDDREQAV